MRQRSITIFMAIGVMTLAGCASHVYAPGPGMSAAQFGPDSARCRLFAEGTRPDTLFEAYGSPRTVAVEAGAMIVLGGITTARHDNEAYDNCMQANGWLVADNAAAGPNVTQPVATAGAVPQQVRSAVAPAACGARVSGCAIEP